ncbi:bifunctional DNA-formamidopyrimidine glycosylase/DNA-(apurinic or apyrimidinic site) lyase [Actinomyces minihominis]|uniref:bifunctional DNA-formamidopyrimidine glycosylase/DNA-(apurinic or apyrimidinic site) lyase n=1 Tax=Actinomyces minihominis TaxID=2002838 RepID=UPI000C081B98|nr:bifunctional DNA-formamidopyrimidine glycosylase/DNA-(apurinic or apyrimidinic site) lyase [Actinomyces minihominis]
MPELPEVETIRRGIERHLKGRTITRVEGEGGRLVRKNAQGMIDLHTHLTDAVVTGVERRGKFMWLLLEDSDLSLVIHLGMSGHVRVVDTSAEPLARHEHVRLALDSGKHASFIDPRMFGHLTISPLVEDPSGRLIPEGAVALAPDPLEDVPLDTWTKPLGKTRRFIKTALLDQAIVSGIGNIYADEALFRVGINGLERASSLPSETVTRVVEMSRDVMVEAVEVGGTSFDSLYLNTDGDPGYFARSLHVYGREGEPCLVCGALIVRENVNGRSHHYCPSCQPPPEES